MRLVIVLSVLGAVLGSGCLGDQSIEVVYRNDTGANITVYPYGRDYPKVARVVAADSSQKDNLLVGDTQPSTHVARVEAVDTGGNLIYCHSFNYGELKGLSGQIRIRRGDNTC